MTNILIYGTKIIGTDPVDSGEKITCGGAEYKKTLIPGWQIVAVTLPAGYAEGKYIYSGGQVIPCPVHAAATCTATCTARCLEVDALWAAKLWTNYTATFPPNGVLLERQRVIQFRNSGDQDTAMAVHSDALSKIVVGTPTAGCRYYTEDNDWQYTTATEMYVILKGLFDAKQILKVKATEHKAAMRALMALGDTAGILAYNIQAGW